MTIRRLIPIAIVALILWAIIILGLRWALT